VLGAAALISVSAATARVEIEAHRIRTGRGDLQQAGDREGFGLPTYRGREHTKTRKRTLPPFRWGCGAAHSIQAGGDEDGIERRAGEDCGVLQEGAGEIWDGFELLGIRRRRSGKDKDESSNKLTCDDNRKESGEGAASIINAGTKEKQHCRPAEWGGSLFQLVYVEARGDDKDKVGQLRRLCVRRGCS